MKIFTCCFRWGHCGAVITYQFRVVHLFSEIDLVSTEVYTSPMSIHSKSISIITITVHCSYIFYLAVPSGQGSKPENGVENVRKWLRSDIVNTRSRNEIELRNDKCSFKCSLKKSSSRLKGLGTWGDLFMGISCSTTKIAYSGRMV